MEFLNTIVSMPGAGFVETWDNVLKYWVTPIYLAFVAFMAFKYLKNESIMKLITFVGIAAVVGVLIFAGADLFGSKDKGLTGAANEVAKNVNTVITPVELTTLN